MSVLDNTLDSSYRCTKCQFWIHKSCGDAPHSFQFQFHKHPLIFSSSLPPQHRRFAQHCRLCSKTLNVLDWLYYCGGCRYFTHFGCARSSSMFRSPITGLIKLERRIGKFMRKFVLPENANLEAINAVCQDGVLTVTVEKLPPPEPKKPKIIDVKIA